MDKLELIPVVDLLDKDFFIPSYQRGYRWEERQIIDLLEDILEFQKKGKEEGEFYCLQPIVVTQRDNGLWEVIDGQQRLTSLYLILRYLQNLLEEDYFIENIYNLSYETREKDEYSSKVFLENIQSIEGEDTTNPDFYHISRAYLIIKKWFADNIKERRVTKRTFLGTLIDTELIEVENGTKDIANNIRFIWYEVTTQNEEEAKNIFTRINMGKIPLTNAELIKALFFINENQTIDERDKHQQKLAYEWENIENSLQDKSFWFFLNKSESTKSTNIEFIFDLIADKYKRFAKIKVNKDIDQYYTFYIFNDLITNNQKTKMDLWDEIKVYFRTFEEWYHNNQYYHLIGYLVHTGTKIEEIKSLAENNKKSTFANELIKLIRLGIKSDFQLNSADKLIELSYRENKGKIIDNILLLLNVISTLDSKYTRFPFERFIQEKWSLEHIHAQASKELKTDKQRIALLEEQKIYFQKQQANKIVEKIELLLSADALDSDAFNELQDELFKQYIDDSSTRDIDAISNLALLSVGDNSVLKNNIFPIKRDKIIELDEKGSFIPLCTKNVFLKYYSKEVDQNSVWTQKDRNAYLQEIKTRLTRFLPEEKDNHEN